MIAPLRILMISITASVGALIWSFVFLLFVMIAGSIVVTTLIQDSIMDPDGDAEIQQACYDYFGRFSHSMITIWEITLATGAWATTGRLLIFNISEWYVLFFVPYVWGVSFAVLRVITALFIKETLQAAGPDPEVALVKRKKKTAKEHEMLRMLFDEADE